MEELFKLLFKPDTFAMALCIYLLVRFEQSNNKFAEEIRVSNKSLAEDLRTSIKDLIDAVTENNRLCSMMILKGIDNGKNGISIGEVITTPDKK